MLRLTLFRVPIIITWGFGVLLLLLALWSAYSRGCGVVDMLTFVLAAFVAFLVHELGHALVGRFCGGGQAFVRLFYLGGDSVNPEARLTRWQGIAMTAAGPALNLLTAAVGFLILWLNYACPFAAWDCTWEYLKGGVPEPSSMSGLAYLLRHLIVVSFWWALFNLLPVFPLDGGQILCGLMSKPRKAYFVSAHAAAVFALTFFVLGWWLLALLMGFLLYFNARCSRA